MKKMFSITMICLLLFVSMNASIATEKNDGSNFKESIIIKSNDKQIKMLNELNHKSLSKAEVYKKVFPKKFTKMPKELKKALSKIEFKLEKRTADVNDIQSLNFDVNAIDDMNKGSYISLNGNAIKYRSKTETYGEKDWIFTESSLHDADTREVVAFESKTIANTDFCEVIEYAYPPTGSYYTHGWHVWPYVEFGQVHTFSVPSVSADDMDYVNPYE